MTREHSNEGRIERVESFDESQRFDNRPEVVQTAEAAANTEHKGGHQVPLDPHGDSGE